MEEYYRVERIDEPDYGCEGLPDGEEMICEVMFRADGGEKVIRVPDRVLTDRKIGRDSLVVISPEYGLLRVVRVAAAVIEHNGRILAARRGYGKWKDYWEFPGGKIEPGESPEEAVVRELLEEMAAHIVIEAGPHRLEYDYPDSHLSMDCFLCRLDGGEHVQLLEHEDAVWLPAERLPDLNWLPADRSFIAGLGTWLDEQRAKQKG